MILKFKKIFENKYHHFNMEQYTLYLLVCDLIIRNLETFLTLLMVSQLFSLACCIPSLWSILFPFVFNNYVHLSSMMIKLIFMLIKLIFMLIILSTGWSCPPSQPPLPTTPPIATTSLLSSTPTPMAMIPLTAWGRVI